MAEQLPIYCQSDSPKADESKTNTSSKPSSGAHAKTRYTPLPPAVQRKVVTRLITYFETK